jgi:hypothetical protein
MGHETSVGTGPSANSEHRRKRLRTVHGDGRGTRSPHHRGRGPGRTPGVEPHHASSVAAHRSSGSARHRVATLATRLPTITAGLRAFSPSFPLTQRHAVYVHDLEADLRPIRRDWVGRSSLQVAGSRSFSRMHPGHGTATSCWR